MKVIYMEQTLMAIAQLTQETPEIINGIINSGIIKQTESGIKYLVIEESKTKKDGK